MPTSCLAFFSDCIRPRPSKAQASDSPLSSGLSTVTEAKFGPRAKLMKAQHSFSRFPGTESTAETRTMDSLGRILIVEDDPKDVDLTMTALEEYNLANEVVVVRDGEEALDYLYCRGKFQTRANDNPAVVLLDLKLPKV